MAYGKVDGLHCPRCAAGWAESLRGKVSGGAPDMFTVAAPFTVLAHCAACGNGWLRRPAPFRGGGNVDGLTGGAPPAWESMGAPRKVGGAPFRAGWQGAAMPTARGADYGAATVLAFTRLAGWAAMMPAAPMAHGRNPAQAARGAYDVTVLDSLRDSDGWTVWQGAEPTAPRRLTLHTAPTGGAHGPTQPRSYVDGGATVPGARKGAQDRTEHLAFCSAMVSRTVRHGARNAAGGRLLRTVARQCQETGKGAAWQCPTHGAGATVGATLPRPLDGKRVRVVHTVDGRKAEHDGKEGIACVPAPTAPIMGAYSWPTRRTAPTVDGGAVMLYGWSVLARDGAPWAPLDGTVTRDGRKVARAPMGALTGAAYLLDIRTRTGATRKGAPRKRARAALIARDAQAATVLDRQAARRTVTATSRAARVAAGATRKARSAARVAALRDSLVTV